MTGSQQTRQKTLEGSGEIVYPELEGAEHIVEYLYEVGPVLHNGDGVIPITWTELSNWSKSVGLALTAWEYQTIRGLSVLFAQEASLSKDPKRIAPWNNGRIDRKVIASGIEKAFQNFAKMQANKKG
jgi:hypothetical protein